MDLILGIDTSNYTTSLCAVQGDDGSLVSEARQLLPVQRGERGLRQSDALFFHVEQLPKVMSRLMQQISASGVATGEHRWVAAGVSVRPRPFASSYMPVFRAGAGFAEALSAMLGIPLVRTSHQEGHLAAADRELQVNRRRGFVGVHLSGGTSDVVYARQSRMGYAISQLGTSSDLHAGQFVDRVGVALGLPFPAGPELEELAVSQSGKRSFRISSSVKGSDMSFSGPCSAALRAVRQGVPKEEIASAVFDCVANSVVKAVQSAMLVTDDIHDCVLAGGVISNQFVRARVLHRLGTLCPNLSVHFAAIPYASDNALGVATIAYRWYRDG